MKILKRHIGDAPTFLVFCDDPHKAATKGCILLYHGFSASKAVHQKEYESLAKHGYLVVAVDNAGHGERRLPDWDVTFADENQWEANFLRLVDATIAEIPSLVDALVADRLIVEGRLGMCGISMGGIITYGALLREPRIRVATPLIATPKWHCLKHLGHPYAPTAILSQTAGLDEVVNGAEAEAFHKGIADQYRDCPERSQWLSYPHSPHMMRGEDWDEAWQKVVSWFGRFLAP